MKRYIRLILDVGFMALVVGLVTLAFRGEFRVNLSTLAMATAATALIRTYT